MNKLKNLLISTIIFFLFSQSAFSQIQNWDSKPSKKVIKGIGNVASSIIADSFSPMTHYKKGEIMISFSPAYFNIKKAYNDPEITGDNLTGFSLGFGTGYALTDNILLYGIFAGMKIDGGLKAKTTELNTSFPLNQIETNATVSSNYKLYSFYLGTGYDFAPEKSKWSIILFGGFSFQKYIVDANYNYTTPTSLPFQYSLNSRISGNNELYGLTLSLITSRQITDKIKLSPYFLYNRSLNKPKIQMDIVQQITAPSTSTEEETNNSNLDNTNLNMFGFDIAYLATDKISISFNIGGMITSTTSLYNDTFLNGLSINSFIMSISYKN